MNTVSLDSRSHEVLLSVKDPRTAAVDASIDTASGFPLEKIDGKRILLVDDDSELRKLTRAFLIMEGYEVSGCADADRALLIAQKANFDLLVTDFCMPGLSGIQLAERLSSMRSGLPVLIISGELLTNEQLRLIRNKGWRFLEKPFSIPTLLGAIANALDGSREEPLQRAG